MIVRSQNRSVEIRAAQEFPFMNPQQWRRMEGGYSNGRYVGEDAAFSLPTLLQAIRLVSVNVAQLGAIVYDERDPNNRVPAPNSWQQFLLGPQGDFNPFDLFSDITAQVDGFGNSFIHKLKNRGKVTELVVIDPNRVAVHKSSAGEKLFDVYQDDNTLKKNMTEADILHVRGFTVNGAMSGLSLVQTFRLGIGNMLGSQEFLGAFFKQGSVVPYALKVPGEVNQQDAEEILQIWEETHGGILNMHRPGLLSNGAEIEKLGMSMVDAEWVDGQKWSVEEGARMANVPVELLQPSNADTSRTEEVLLKFLTLYVKPRVERIAAAFNADMDLFAGSDYSVDFDYSKLREADLSSLANFSLKMRQAGILTANEARARIGYGPLVGGDELLAIPVGAGGGTQDNSGGDNSQ